MAKQTKKQKEKHEIINELFTTDQMVMYTGNLYKKYQNTQCKIIKPYKEEYYKVQFNDGTIATIKATTVQEINNESEE